MCSSRDHFSEGVAMRGDYSSAEKIPGKSLRLSPYLARCICRIMSNGFCIFIDTFFDGPVPALTDGDDNYVVFETELEAQREIADHAMIRLQQFLDGERDFEDAITVEEYVVPIRV